jgi:hypothetical protein
MASSSWISSFVAAVRSSLPRRVTADDVAFAVDFEQLPKAATANALQVWHLVGFPLEAATLKIVHTATPWSNVCVR